MTLHFVSSSKMSRASGKERASRSSLVATNVLAARQAASASEDPTGPDLCRSGRGRNVGAIVAEAERVQGRRAERWDLAALLRRGRIPRSSSCRARTSGDGRGPPRDAQKGRPAGCSTTCVTPGGAWRCALGHLALRTEGAGNPAGPSGREESPSSTRSTAPGFLIVATLHMFGGFFFPGSWPRCARYSMPAARRRS